MLDHDREKGWVVPEVDDEIAASAFVVMAEGFADEWLTQGRRISERDIDQLADLWIRGTYRSEAPK